MVLHGTSRCHGAKGPTSGWTDTSNEIRKESDGVTPEKRSTVMTAHCTDTINSQTEKYQTAYNGPMDWFKSFNRSVFVAQQRIRCFQTRILLTQGLIEAKEPNAILGPFGAFMTSSLRLSQSAESGMESDEFSRHN